MNIGIIGGTGRMGSTLGRLWAARGHAIFVGSRDPDKARELAASLSETAQGGTYQEAGDFGAVVLLATPWHATHQALIEADLPADKILVDCTNPVAPGGGGLALGHASSGAEAVAVWAAGTQVVKAFNTVHFANLGNPAFNGQAVSLFYCGDNEAAKDVVARLGRELGFEPVDCGPLISARYLEPLGFLWIELAFNCGLGPNIAFKLLRR